MNIEIPFENKATEQWAWIEQEAHYVSSAGMAAAVFASGCGVESARLYDDGHLALAGSKHGPFAGFSDHAVGQEDRRLAIARLLWSADPKMGLQMMIAQPRAIYCGNAALSLFKPGGSPPVKDPPIWEENERRAYADLEAFGRFLDIGEGTVDSLSDSLWDEAIAIVEGNERAVLECYDRLKNGDEISASHLVGSCAISEWWPVGEQEVDELLEEARAAGLDAAMGFALEHVERS